jgi:hypothetical protein
MEMGTVTVQLARYRLWDGHIREITDRWARVNGGRTVAICTVEDNLGEAGRPPQ